MILVVGGTGRLGEQVVTGLLACGHEVRVLSRGLHAPPVPDDSRVDRVVGDVRDPRAVDRAMTGVTTVVSAAHGFVGAGRVSPASVDRDGNVLVVEAARRDGAEIVLLSVLGASGGASWDLLRMKYAAEQVAWASGCPVTVIRPAAFVQTWLEVLRSSAGRGHRPRLLGRGDNPIPWVDVREVASVAVRAVDDRGLRGHTLELVGPERLTLLELASAMMTAVGWAGEPQRVPRAVVHVVARTVGVARPQVARICRAALVMDELVYPDDAASRALVPGLPATPASRIAADLALAGSGY